MQNDTIGRRVDALSGFTVMLLSHLCARTGDNESLNPDVSDPHHKNLNPSDIYVQLQNLSLFVYQASIGVIVNRCTVRRKVQ